MRQLEKLGVDRIEIGQSSGHAQIGKTLATLSAVLEHALPCVVSELDEHAVLRAAELFSGRKHGVIRLHVPVEALHGSGGESPYGAASSWFAILACRPNCSFRHKKAGVMSNRTVYAG